VQDTPFIGNVNPPSGPWNERITMVSIGPYKKSTKAANSAANQ